MKKEKETSELTISEKKPSEIKLSKKEFKDQYQISINKFIEDLSQCDELKHYVEKRDKINRLCQGMVHSKRGTDPCTSYNIEYYWLKDQCADWEIVYCERCKNKYVLPNITRIYNDYNLKNVPEERRSKFETKRIKDLCVNPNCFNKALYYHSDYPLIKLCCETHKNLITDEKCKKISELNKKKK